MPIDRRRFLTMTAAGVTAAAQPLTAAAAAATSLQAAQFGVRPGSPDDQTRTIQRAIDEAARTRVPLFFPPGVYRAGMLNLATGVHLIGVAGASRLVLTGGPSLISSRRADDIALAGLVLDGGGQPLAERRGLVHLADGRRISITDCEIVGSGQHGLVLEQIEGGLARSTVSDVRGTAVFALDSKGLMIAGNTIRGAGNNGIQVWRSQSGDDGTLVIDNRIEEIAARAGGSGQNGNAINVYRAGNVIVRGNRIRNAAFSAVRGNAASNLQIVTNTCTGSGEVALYAEFGFEGTLIANNIVDGAALGVSVTNFKEGGRLAIVQGNLIRNLVPQRPPGTDPNDAAGVGIGVEADTAVTGNVVENAPTAGIWLGWGPYLRDVSVTGNIVRATGIGIAVSVAPEAGAALISDNLITGTKVGAIVGMDWKTPVAPDLARDAARYPRLTVRGNRVD